MVTSFSSKSELALNLSTDGEQLTFMGYLAGINDVDVSNSNTPLAPDPTNPVTAIDYRLVAQVDAKGKFRFTKTNAYSGNNGRAAILHNTDGSNVYFTAGNAGNGGNPQPVEIVLGAGTQFIPAEVKALAAQTPGSTHAARKLQRHAVRREARQGRKGRQLPWPDDLQRRRVPHEGQRRQRCEHRLLHRHLRRTRVCSGG